MFDLEQELSHLRSVEVALAVARKRQDPQLIEQYEQMKAELLKRIRAIS
ncbi:hypothetical protein [Thermosynechococcus sp. FA-CM-4201]